MRRYIKFMTGFQSIEKLERELNRIGIPIAEVDYGIVKFSKDLNLDQSLELNMCIHEIGFEVLAPDSSDLLDQATRLIKELIYDTPEIDIGDYPAFLENKLGCGLFELDSLFSQVYGMSVCQSARIYQVERIKEMILYEDLSLSQVAEMMHLKDEAVVQQLFKEITGLSHTYYQQVRDERKMVQLGKDSFTPVKQAICIKGINIAN